MSGERSGDAVSSSHLSVDDQIRENHRTGNFKRCPGRSRHWNVYYGEVGTSTPVCTNCGAPNANYRPDDDPRRGETWAADFVAELTREPPA